MVVRVLPSSANFSALQSLAIEKLLEISDAPTWENVPDLILPALLLWEWPLPPSDRSTEEAQSCLPRLDHLYVSRKGLRVPNQRGTSVTAS